MVAPRKILVTEMTGKIGYQSPTLVVTLRRPVVSPLYLAIRLGVTVLTLGA